ncbi:MAG: DUF935 domain-containing protein [Bacteroides sp.]|nr:DUF935 domain-containing protein [Bacteroides sp.]
MFDEELLRSIFRTSIKTIQEYIREIERNNRYKSVLQDVSLGTILDNRSGLIDLYEACLEQDAHIKAVIETLKSQILGDRYMLARMNEKGKYVKDVSQTQKIQGSQFDKIIRGIVKAKLYGFTLLEIMPGIDKRTGKLAEVNIVERQNVLPDQMTVVKRQGIWLPNWNIRDPVYSKNYVIINKGGIGLFSATTPFILAKKFTVANYVNFSHTYSQPIIHGKTVSENNMDRKRLANNIANAAQNKVVVTGIDDVLDIKTFTMSNSEKIYTSLIEFVNQEISNMILGSKSMAGATQSYIGSTKAHQDIFRERIEVYRRFIENIMNEEIIPQLVVMGYIDPGLEFKYSNYIEEFGIHVGKQLNLIAVEGSGGSPSTPGKLRKRVMSEQEYYKRYGKSRTSEVVNFLQGVR